MPFSLSENINQIIHVHPKYGPIRLLGAEKTIDDNVYLFTKCDVIFDNTGYRTTLAYDTIKKNCVKDYLYPEILGIACKGYASSKENPSEYSIWGVMIRKCYDPNAYFYNSFGALGYFVNSRWHRFDYFLEDFKKYPKPDCDPNIQIRFKIKPELVAAGCREFSFENCGLFPYELNIKLGEIYSSNNYGDFIALDYVFDENGNKRLKIRFILTGYETTIKPVYALTGAVSDPYYPHIYGVGYRGMISTKDHQREHNVWTKMLSRCYNPNDKSYKFYGAIGITVCDRWHCFANFCEDIKSLPNYDKWLIKENQYELDKDYLQQGIPNNMKIYSPQTCCFLSSAENVALSFINIHNKSNREYYGVETTKANNYTVTIRNDDFGTYSNIEAAANARDYRVKWFGIQTPLNFQQPTMQPSEWLSYRVGAKPMMEIVGPMKDPWDK